MFKVNQDYLKLPGSYLFSTVARKQREYQAAHPEAEIIKLSIGDVTQPLAPAIVEALHGAVDEMAHAETFHGYAPDLGYEFLRSAMAKNDYQAKDATSMQMRSSFPTEQKKIAVISRKSSQRTARSLYVIQYIRFM